METPLAWGREICGDLGASERREWLCANGIGGFAAGTVAGGPTRRYHGLLVAALQPPLGRTLLAAQVHETVEYEGQRLPLATSRWAGGAVDPDGFRHVESFRLDGTSPVWTYACGDALVEKRVWMEPGANTTYVRYAVLRARAPLGLTLPVLVNYRDYHATTRAGDWSMVVARAPHGVRVTAFDGAHPFVLLAAGAEARPAHAWFRDFDLARESERGLDHLDDALHAVTFDARLAPGASLTLVASAETAPALDGEAAWERRAGHDSRVLQRWTAARPESAATPGWIRQLVLAADQFVVRRATPEDPDGLTVMAGYHWFGDWGRDTMIALPGLTLATGRPDAARSILTTFARFVDRGMLPNRFPDAGEVPTTGCSRNCSRSSAASSPRTAGAHATASARTLPMACSRPASRACSSRGWMPRSATGWSRPAPAKRSRSTRSGTTLCAPWRRSPGGCSNRPESTGRSPNGSRPASSASGTHRAATATTSSTRRPATMPRCARTRSSRCRCRTTRCCRSGSGRWSTSSRRAC
jgi:hypothetical protein